MMDTPTHPLTEFIFKKRSICDDDMWIVLYGLCVLKKACDFSEDKKRELLRQF